MFSLRRSLKPSEQSSPYGSAGTLLPYHPGLDTSLPSASSVGQIDALQLLRALAVILVVWFHSGLELDAARSRALPDAGVFGIDIFFVISGFILSVTVLKDRGRPGANSMCAFIVRRFIRIYPIYWFVAILVIARLMLSHRFGDNYLPSFLLLPSPHYPGGKLLIDPAWTLTFEIFFYLVLALILLKTIKWAIPALMTILTAATCMGAFVDIRRPFWIVASNPILLEFVLGSGIALMYVRLRRRRAVGIVLTASGIMATLYLRAQHLVNVANGLPTVMTDQGVFARVETWGICAALIVSGLVLWSPSMKSTLGRWFVLLGNSSYSAYLLSMLILEYGTRLYFRISMPPHTLFGRFLYQSTMTLSTIGAGLLCYVLLEKPLLRSLQKRFLPRWTNSPSKSLNAA